MKKLIYAIILLGLIGGGIGMYMFNKTVPTLDNAKPDYNLTANELFDAFDADENSAMQKYENAVISVTGEVVSYKSDDNQNIIILKADNAMAGGINCALNDKISNIQVGKTVTIKGRCQGFLIDVVLNNCNVEL